MSAELAADLDAAFPAFVRSHATAVHSAALRLTGSRADAEEVTSETFLRAYEALRAWPPDRIAALHGRGWLLAVTLNVVRNDVRRRSRRPDEVLLGAHDRVAAAPDPAAVAAANDGLERLAELVARLPEEQRAPVVLRHVSGLSYAEVADALGAPVGTVKAQVSRGIARLRTMLEAEES